MPGETHKPTRVVKVNVKQFDLNRLFFAPLPFNTATNPPASDVFDLHFEKPLSLDYDIGYRRIWRLFFMHLFGTHRKPSNWPQDDSEWPASLDFAVDVNRREATFRMNTRNNKNESFSPAAIKMREQALINCTSVQSPCPVRRFNSEAFEKAIPEDVPADRNIPDMITIKSEDLWHFTIQRRNMQYGYVQTLEVNGNSYREWVPADINCQAPDVADMNWDEVSELTELHDYVRSPGNQDLAWTFTSMHDVASHIQKGSLPPLILKFLHSTSAALRAPRICTHQEKVRLQAQQRTPVCMEADIFEHKALRQRCSDRLKVDREEKLKAGEAQNITNNEAAMYALNVDPPMFDMAEQAYRKYLQYRQLFDNAETGEGLTFRYSRRWQKYLLRLQQIPGANGMYVYDRQLQYSENTFKDPDSENTLDPDSHVVCGTFQSSAANVAQPHESATGAITEQYLRCIPLRNYNNSRTSREMQTGAPSQRHNVNTMYRKWLLEQESRLQYGWMKPRFSDTKYQLLPENYRLQLDHYYQVQYKWTKWWTKERSANGKAVLTLEPCRPKNAPLDASDELQRPITGAIARDATHTLLTAQADYVTYWLQKQVSQWQWIPPTMQRQDKTYLDPLDPNVDEISIYCYLLYAWMRKVVVGNSLNMLQFGFFSDHQNPHGTTNQEYCTKSYESIQTYTKPIESGDIFHLWNDSPEKQQLWTKKLEAMFSAEHNLYFRRKAAFELWFDLCHGVWAPYLALWRKHKKDAASSSIGQQENWDPWLCDRWHMAVYNSNRWQPTVVEKRLSKPHTAGSESTAENSAHTCAFKNDERAYQRIAPDNYAGYAEDLAVDKQNIEIDVPPVLLLCGLPQNDGKQNSQISLDFLGYQDTYKPMYRKERPKKTGTASVPSSDAETEADTDAGTPRGSDVTSDMASDAGNTDRDELETENMDDEPISVIGARHEEHDLDDDTVVDTVIKADNSILFGCALATRWNSKAKQNTRESTVLTDEILQREKWYLSPKYDGVRCRWDGTGLYSRTGNFLFQAPEWLTEALPKCALDGELWKGRNTFQDTWSAVSKQRKQINDLGFEEWRKAWQEVYYVVFDCPGETKQYQHRLDKAYEEIKTHRVHLAPEAKEWSENKLKVVGMDQEPPTDTLFWNRPVLSVDRIEQELAKEQDLFGEGLIARKNDAPYTPGRSNFLVKIKAKRDDEAIVVYCGKGRGQFKGMMGYLWCRTRWGAEFDLSSGLSVPQRQWNSPENHALREGTVVTFTYTDLSSGHKRPKQSVFQRVRPDISAKEFPGWECIADVDMFDSRRWYDKDQSTSQQSEATSAGTDT
jgi:DNA ligase-1